MAHAAPPCAGYLGYLFFQHVEDLFYQYGVDMVFTGHEHNYERTYPVYRDQVDSCEEATCIPYSAVQTASTDLPVQHRDQVELHLARPHVPVTAQRV